ncbi:MAG TPA: RNA-binding cell elongation regulator Jag/EloR [Candidatus Limnocylindria bacterium]|nr:RNA-binding cell elongation regulator Jag/EloR [Candidatus Limnocylindria bacterium]
MTFREFTGKNVEEAIRGAMKEFATDLSELDIEILSQGSRGILGVGAEEARVLAAPKSAVAAAQSVRPTEPPPSSSEPAAESEPAAAPTEAAPITEAEASALDDAYLPARDRGRGGRGRSERNGHPRGEARSRSRGERAPRTDRPERAERAERPDRPQREPLPSIPPKPLEELEPEQRAALEEAKSVLEELLRLMEVEASVEITTGRESSKLNVKGPELGVLIGRRGEKLASLQQIVNLIVAKREGQWHRITVDVENYRGRREEQLHDVAARAAKRVIETGKIIQLDPMPAVERRIVHLALVDNPKVRTQSVGVEPNRRIVILPASKADA